MLLSLSSSACMCAPDTNLNKSSLSYYTEIFFGRKIATEQKDSVKINDEYYFSADVHQLQVLKSWKGNLPQDTVVHIYSFGIGCQNWYLNFLQEDLFIIGVEQMEDMSHSELHGMERFLQTSLCTLTIPIAFNELSTSKSIAILDELYLQPKILYRTDLAVFGFVGFFLIMIFGMMYCR